MLLGGARTRADGRGPSRRDSDDRGELAVVTRTSTVLKRSGRTAQRARSRPGRPICSRRPRPRRESAHRSPVRIPNRTPTRQRPRGLLSRCVLLDTPATARRPTSATGLTRGGPAGHTGDRRHRLRYPVGRRRRNAGQTAPSGTRDIDDHLAVVMHDNPDPDAIAARSPSKPSPASTTSRPTSSTRAIWATRRTGRS